MELPDKRERGGDSWREIVEIVGLMLTVEEAF